MHKQNTYRNKLTVVSEIHEFSSNAKNCLNIRQTMQFFYFQGEKLVRCKLPNQKKYLFDKRLDKFFVVRDEGLVLGHPISENSHLENLCLSFLGQNTEEEVPTACSDFSSGRLSS